MLAVTPGAWTQRHSFRTCSKTRQNVVKRESEMTHSLPMDNASTAYYCGCQVVDRDDPCKLSRLLLFGQVHGYTSNLVNYRWPGTETQGTMAGELTRTSSEGCMSWLEK